MASEGNRGRPNPEGSRACKPADLSGHRPAETIRARGLEAPRQEAGYMPADGLAAQHRLFLARGPFSNRGVQVKTAFRTSHSRSSFSSQSARSRCTIRFDESGLPMSTTCLDRLASTGPTHGMIPIPRLEQRVVRRLGGDALFGQALRQSFPTATPTRTAYRCAKRNA